MGIMSWGIMSSWETVLRRPVHVRSEPRVAREPHVSTPAIESFAECSMEAVKFDLEGRGGGGGDVFTAEELI